MDTLDKILKSHPNPIHLRVKQGEFETVIVTEYPHGYDVSHRYICDSLDDAFHKAIGTPIGFEKPYEWRVYDSEHKPIAQSPNLHLCWPQEVPVKTVMKQYTVPQFISYGAWDVLEDGHFLIALPQKHEAQMLAKKFNEKEQRIEALESEKLGLQNDLAAVTRDRDEWRESCKLANQRIDTTAQVEKENHRLRKMLEAVMGLRNWIEFQFLKGDIEKLLKKEETNG